MNSSSIGSGAPKGAAVKTEWAKDVTAPTNQPIAVREESFGAKLNRMSGVVDTGSVKYGNKDEALSKEAFLKMTMEQIKYQDPLNPVKNDQFTQQMAMLSQLEQQVNMNTTLTSILDTSKNMQIAALQLVGKDVSADTGLLYHDGERASSFQFTLPESVSDLKVEVITEDGEALDVLDMGAREVGAVTAKWDGIMNNGVPAPAGKYSYRIIAKGADGKEVTVPTKIEGRVTGVTTMKGATFLLVGEQKVALNDVQSIHESKQPLMGVQPDGKAAGTENVTESTGAVKSVEEVADAQSAPKASKPQIEVSEGAKTALSGDSELSSLFPLLYR
jgi:flagellar basal-body rod modification protein FlgD